MTKKTGASKKKIIIKSNDLLSFLLRPSGYVFASNELPPWTDVSGSISRNVFSRYEYFMFDTDKDVVQYDSPL